MLGVGKYQFMGLTNNITEVWKVGLLSCHITRCTQNTVALLSMSNWSLVIFSEIGIGGTPGNFDILTLK